MLPMSEGSKHSKHCIAAEAFHVPLSANTVSPALMGPFPRSDASGPVLTLVARSSTPTVNLVSLCRVIVPLHMGSYLSPLLVSFLWRCCRFTVL